MLEETYLGDLVVNTGKNSRNIKKRCNKLMGVISVIMYILKELCLGQFYFEIAMLLRDTMFLSVMTLNSETWINLTKENINELELMDRLLLKQIFELPKSASSASIHLESGATPVRHIIQGKRLMFLHYIYPYIN